MEKKDTRSADIRTKANRNIFAYKGRASRLEFWLICMACIASLFVAGPVIDAMEGANRYIIMVLYILLFIRVISAVAARRCHDIGLSGWAQFNPMNFLRIPFEDSAKT